MDNKQRFAYFQKLHSDLAKQYKIDPYIVQYIRSFAVGLRWTREQMIAHLSHRAATRSLMIEQYETSIKREEARRDRGVRYNGDKLNRTILLLQDLQQNLAIINNTLDTILRISPTTWSALTMRTEFDRAENNISGQRQ